MIPLIELRGSVPIGLSNLWGGPIDILPLYLICIIGNMLPVPVIFSLQEKCWYGEQIKVYRKVFKFCLDKGEKGGKNFRKKQDEVYTGHYLFLLVFLCQVQELGRVLLQPAY